MRFQLPILVAALVFAGTVGIASADDRQVILESCATGTNMPAKICECIADRAPDELTDGAYAFFMAMISGDEAEQARLRATTPPTDLMAAGMFMTSTPGECAKQ